MVKDIELVQLYVVVWLSLYLLLLLFIYTESTMQLKFQRWKKVCGSWTCFQMLSPSELCNKFNKSTQLFEGSEQLICFISLYFMWCDV